MNRRPNEPLDAEEAALAAQLSRLGPHGEPSPQLDARILAAAHDAVAAQPRARTRSRWPLGLGVAASALLALGIGWQLRPQHEAALDREFAAAVEQPASAAGSQDAAASAAAARAAADADATASQPEEAAAAVAAAVVSTKPEPVAAPESPTLPANASPSAVYNPPPAPRAVAKVQRAPAPAQQAPAEAPFSTRPLRTPGTPTAAELAAQDNTTLDSVSVPSSRRVASAPPPPPAPPMAAGSDAARGNLSGVVADPQTYAAIAAQREQARAEHARNAAANADRLEYTRARRASEASTDMQDAIAPTAAAKSVDINGGGYGPEFGRSTGGVVDFRSQANGKTDQFSPGVTRQGLKRTDLQLPVAEDTKLDADDWLERIRLRRDLGDRASAVESLLRFRQAHPFQKTPEDLQELLAE